VALQKPNRITHLMFEISIGSTHIDVEPRPST